MKEKREQTRQQPPLGTGVQNIVKNVLRSVVASAGYQLYRLPPRTPGATYEIVHPNATYAPWNHDEQFQQCYQAIRGHTLVDVYRCWELWTLVGQTAKLSQGGLIEVGVWRGGTAALIAQRARSVGIKEPIYLCDTFTGVVNAGARDTIYKGGEHNDTSREVVDKLLFSRLQLENICIMEGVFPEQTAGRIDPNASFRFCHIDLDVYQSARDTVNWIWPRLLPDGVVVFDDYGFFGCEGITQLVNEFATNNRCLWLHNLNGHAILVKLP